MAKSNIEVHNGVRNWYGPRSSEHLYPSSPKTDGYEKELAVDYAYDELPTYSTDGSMVIEIPANSLIVSATLNVLEAAAGGTAYDIGMYQPDGTVILINGLVSAADAPTANLVAGAWITGTGGLVGTTTGPNGGQLVVTANGTFTAGSYRLIVSYVLPRA